MPCRQRRVSLISPQASPQASRLGWRIPVRRRRRYAHRQRRRTFGVLKPQTSSGAGDRDDFADDASSFPPWLVTWDDAAGWGMAQVEAKAGGSHVDEVRIESSPEAAPMRQNARRDLRRRVAAIHATAPVRRPRPYPFAYVPGRPPQRSAQRDRTGHQAGATQIVLVEDPAHEFAPGEQARNDPASGILHGTVGGDLQPAETERDAAGHREAGIRRLVDRQRPIRFRRRNRLEVPLAVQDRRIMLAPGWHAALNSRTVFTSPSGLMSS